MSKRFALTKGATMNEKALGISIALSPCVNQPSKTSQSTRESSGLSGRTWVGGGQTALSGRPMVVIPLSRAVVCGEDHVYDSLQFAACPNCTGQDRLLLEDLLASRRSLRLAL